VFPYSSLLQSSAMPRRFSLFRASTLAGLALAGVAGLASWLPIASAQAAPEATCPSTTPSQPFLEWGDSNHYAVIPGGDFELSPSLWTFSQGAQRACGSEPYAVTGELGAWSLALPAGASAQSPFFSLTPSVEKSFRLFARSEGTDASVVAQVVYKTSTGTKVTPGWKLALTGSWLPSSSLTVMPPPGGASTVEAALRVTSKSGTALIDDVYVDPRMR
jgi:hypothetical protein